jgi:recombination protein RecT
MAVAEVLPKHLTAERILKAALIAASKQPKLLQCTRDSFVKAVMVASELGLDCSGTLGSSYLVPYGRECALIIGYRGLIDLARRSGEISSIEAHVVYEEDNFAYELGMYPKLTHQRNLESECDDSKIRYVYMVATLKDGTKQVEVMTRAQVEKIRAGSKAGHKGPWVEHWGEMARKTVVRRGIKYLPLSPELQQRIHDDDERSGYMTEVASAADHLPERRTEALADRLLTSHETPEADDDRPNAEEGE